jgi:hypothetical protein
LRAVSGGPLEQITGGREGAMDFAILNLSGGHGQEYFEHGAPDRRHVRLRPSDVGSIQLSLFVGGMQAVMRTAVAMGCMPRGTTQTKRYGQATAPRLSTQPIQTARSLS